MGATSSEKREQYENLKLEYENGETNSLHKKIILEI